WQLGALFCKLSTWINATTSCASIYTLVAVTADRYLAICHTLKYTLWEAGYTLYVIAGIWIVSGSLATPSLYGYDEIRDERIKLRVATMMLTVIVVFALCWLPLYEFDGESQQSIFAFDNDGTFREGWNYFTDDNDDG
ncbi:hypothetical protein TELCIR_17723, partial [Teladorsagia circumcincta]